MNPLPNDKILDLSKYKAFTDDNLNVYPKLTFALGRIENIVGKGENAGYEHFFLFPKCFQKDSSSGSVKVGIVWYRVKLHSSCCLQLFWIWKIQNTVT